MDIPFFDLDEKIVEHEEKPIAQIFAEDGEEYFRLLEKDVLHLLTESHETFVMACGGGTPCFFNNIDYLKKAGIVLWINSSMDCLYDRLVLEKDKRPLISNIPDNELRGHLIKKYSDRKIFYQQATVTVSEDNITLDLLVDAIFHA